MRDRRMYNHSVFMGIGVALVLSGPLAVTAPEARADPGSYVFTELARTDGKAPGSGSLKFDIDFEPWAINASGNVAFVADLQSGGTDIGEGIFASRQGQLIRIARPGQPAPGGGTFASTPGCCGDGHTPLNNAGDGAFIYTLEPVDPNNVVVNAGLYRFSLLTPTLTAVVVPGSTPAPTPTGGTFAGVYFDASLNSRRDLMFGGISPRPPQIPCPGSRPCDGLGVGVFKADKTDHIVSIVAPGDPAPPPHAGVFDAADHGWISDAGEIAFEAHVKGEECIDIGTPFLCGGSVYKRSAKGQIQSIAHQGDPAPGGGTYRLAFGPVMNSAGDLIFIGDLTPAPEKEINQGVFFFDSQAGTTAPVVRPGDAMPGGGNFVTASGFAYQYSLNNPGDVSFIGRLDTHADINPVGVGDTGLYVASHGSLHVVARTGTFIPSVGTIAQINNPILSDTGFSSSFAAGGAINDRGQILFEATLADQTTGVLFVATPRGSH
jgi:hypothetical protein